MQAGLFEVRRIPVDIVDDNGDPETNRSLQQRLSRQMKAYTSLKIWEIDIAEIQKRVRTDEWVQNVRITRIFPNRIRVSVAAKTPVFMLVTKDGDFRAVTRDASLLAAIQPSILPDVPILRSEIFVQDKKLRRDAIDFLEQLPEDGPLGRRNIAEISYSKDEGYSLTLIGSRTEIKMGEGRIPTKVQRVTQVLNYLAANQIKGRVVDASFSKKVLVRLRK